jgi:hypothetical protein
MLRRTWIAAALVAAGCGGMDGGKGGPVEEGQGVVLRNLGEPFKTSRGEVHVIRVQDEYKLLRCISEGPIAGCYDEVLQVPRAALSEDDKDGIRWNDWIDVPQVPGLKIQFVGPSRIAIRTENGSAPQ